MSDLSDITLGELTDIRNLKDPSFWGCCLLPTGVAAFVMAGCLYKFAIWAFG